MRVELIFSLVLFVLSVTIFFVSGNYSELAATFPRAVAVIMGTLAGIYVVQMLLKKAAPNPFGDYPFYRIILFLVLLVLYLVCLNYMGFYSASFAYYLIITLGLSREKVQKKQIAVSFCSSAAFMGILYFLFSGLLKVQIPSGMFI